MKYDIKVKQPILEAYPQLAQFEEFQGDDDKLRFVIALLDEEGSAFKESNTSRRCSIAAKASGTKFDQESLRDPQIERMICRWFCIHNNHAYELWFSKLVAFGDCNHRLRTGDSATKDLKTEAELSEKLRVDIMKLERQLFRDNIAESKVKEAIQSRSLHFVEKYAETDTVV